VDISILLSVWVMDHALHVMIEDSPNSKELHSGAIRVDWRRLAFDSGISVDLSRLLLQAGAGRRGVVARSVAALELLHCRMRMFKEAPRALATTN